MVQGEIKKILLVNLPFEKFYTQTIIKGVAPSTAPLSLACIGGSLLAQGHEVEIFDFNLYGDDEFRARLLGFKPDYVGITFVTPLIREADRVAKIVKSISTEMIVIGGGPHCSSFPESSLQETALDIAVISEGDFTIQEVVGGDDLTAITGIAYKKGDKILVNDRKEFIKDLDVLPFPAYHLFEIEKYKVSSAIARKNPVAWVETSRGCVYGCIYCNKNCFGRIFRVKSPERVVEEFEKVAQLGFQEIYLTDDGFTTDMKRAKEICDLLVEKKVTIPWSTLNGIRADRVDAELLKKMKRAGCYRIYIGVESGSQAVLDRIKKGTNISQIKNAVKWGKEAGLEVVGYFMLGLPGDTEETLQQTIDFAKSLKLYLAKASIAIPLPATEMFRELEACNKIKTYDWEKYKFHSLPSIIYDHETLPWPVVNQYYRKFYRKMYLDPRFMVKSVINSIRNKTLYEDLKLALSIDWFRAK